MPIVLERKHQRAVVRRFSAASRRSPWFLIGAATLLLAGALWAGPPAIDAGPSGAASGPIVIGFVCTCSGPRHRPTLLPHLPTKRGRTPRMPLAGSTDAGSK